MCAVIPAPAILTVMMIMVSGVPTLTRSLLLGKGGTPHPQLAKSQATLNPWPRRILWVVLTIAAVPVLLFLLYLAVSSIVGVKRPPLDLPSVYQVPTSHGISHIETAEHGVYFDQGEEQVHFAIIHAGGFDPSASRTESSHRPDGSWSSEGDITTKSGRFFSFRRSSDQPDMLKVNGTGYDLRNGRVIVLEDDGKVLQLPLFPSSITLQNLPALASQINSTPALPTGRSATLTEPQLVVGRWYNFYPKAEVKPVSEFTDSSGWRITIHAAKLTQVTNSSELEVTFPSDPQKHFDIIAARARDEEANGQATQEGAAFQEWEKSVKEWTTRRFNRSELERITPMDKPVKNTGA